jgi:hypothetical protein
MGKPCPQRIKSWVAYLAIGHWIEAHEDRLQGDALIIHQAGESTPVLGTQNVCNAIKMWRNSMKERRHLMNCDVPELMSAL